ncbi:hypothetical protein ABZ479_29845 [Streptomyces sp. NPDC005722]
MIRVQHVLECDWPQCAATLTTPFANETDVKQYAAEQGWVYTPCDAVQFFCGTWEDGKRTGHGQQVLDGHWPALMKVPGEKGGPGFFVGCFCGWSETGMVTASTQTGDQARTIWSQHLPQAVDAA